MSINVKDVKKNAYRITKTRGKTALRIRVPGGHLEVKYFDIIKTIANKYGDGSVHITTRQGFEIPNIDFKFMDEINKMIRPILKGLELDIGVDISNPSKGYPAAGTRNVSACIGNKVCQYGNVNTTNLARKIEKEIFPNDYHVKIAVTGCPNDCIKAHLQDFGIIATIEPQYDKNRCISCEACVEVCKNKVTEALKLENYSVIRDEDKCIGCGECVLKCPTGATTRSERKYYRLVIMGRTGKKNPRLAKPFIKWVDEDSVMKIIKNTYNYVDKYINRSLPKEHIGYIVDRTGFTVFKEEVLKGVKLGPKAQVANYIDFGGYMYNREIYFKGVNNK